MRCAFLLLFSLAGAGAPLAAQQPPPVPMPESFRGTQLRMPSRSALWLSMVDSMPESLYRDKVGGPADPPAGPPRGERRRRITARQSTAAGARHRRPSTRAVASGSTSTTRSTLPRAS
jgi:hypothetical protein